MRYVIYSCTPILDICYIQYTDPTGFILVTANQKNEVLDMVKFSSYIKRQKNRGDSIGCFASDFCDIPNNPFWAKSSGVNDFESETLYGLYRHLPLSAKNDEVIIETMIDIWKEWLKENHIGLRFHQGKRGYVYFFNIQGQTAFKVGRTTQHPEARKRDVQSEAKTELNSFNWLHIENYDVIENELKKAFSPQNYSREWYEIDDMHVNEAIILYRKTDSLCTLMREPTETEIFHSEVQDVIRKSVKQTINHGS